MLYSAENPFQVPRTPPRLSAVYFVYKVHANSLSQPVSIIKLH